MFVLRSLIPTALALAILVLGISCSDSSAVPDPIVEPDRTAVITETLTATSPGGAGFTVPAGTIVTSNSVVDGKVTLGVSDLSTAAAASFEGTVHGGATYTPTDATFNSPIEISIPVTGLSGPASVYYAGGGFSQAGFRLHANGLTVINGRINFSSTKFGTYVVGTITDVHNQGGGGSF